MYKDFYRLKREPFGSHPDPDFIYTSNTHREAWYYLLYGIDTQEPFLVLTGEYGMGKTLLCLRLMRAVQKRDHLPVVFISTPSEGYRGILRHIAIRMNITDVPKEENLIQDLIFDSIRSQPETKRFYLIIDDAHELEIDSLTRLKQLSAFNHNGFFPFIIIFVAHPSFLQGEKNTSLTSLYQRIRRRYHLSAFTFEDTRNYIHFRLQKSGFLKKSVLPDETLKMIFQYSRGIPRLINHLCDTCLLIGSSRGLLSIPPEVVKEARKIVDGSLLDSYPESASQPMAEGSRPTSPQPDSRKFIEPVTVVPIRHDMDPDTVKGPPATTRKIASKTVLTIFALLLILLAAFSYNKWSAALRSDAPGTGPPELIRYPIVYPSNTSSTSRPEKHRISADNFLSEPSSLKMGALRTFPSQETSQ